MLRSLSDVDLLVGLLAGRGVVVPPDVALRVAAVAERIRDLPAERQAHAVAAVVVKGRDRAPFDGAWKQLREVQAAEAERPGAVSGPPPGPVEPPVSPRPGRRRRYGLAAAALAAGVAAAGVWWAWPAPTSGPQPPLDEPPEPTPPPPEPTPAEGWAVEPAATFRYPAVEVYDLAPVGTPRWPFLLLAGLGGLVALLVWRPRREEPPPVARAPSGEPACAPPPLPRAADPGALRLLDRADAEAVLAVIRVRLERAEEGADPRPAPTDCVPRG